MPFIAANLKDIPESRPVAQGVYDLTILEAEVGESQNGNPQMVFSIGIDGNDEAPNVRHYVSLPVDGEDPKKSRFKLLMCRRFFELFSIDVAPEGFDPDQIVIDAPGKKGRAELRINDTGDYNNLQVPKIKDDSAPAAGRRSAPKPPKR